MKLWLLAVPCVLMAASGRAHTQGAPPSAAAPDPADAICPRPATGAVVQAPAEMRSTHGVLELTLHLRTAFDVHRLQRFCYRATLANGTEVEAPTLRVVQGDVLVIHFANEITTDIQPQTAFPQAAHPVGERTMHDHAAMNATTATGPGLPSATNPADAPCFATSMSARGSNLHFHGIDAAPVCHQDEVLRTMVRSGETFDYRVSIPANEPPGLYWYHPHPHGYSEAQVLGGASGALIVEAKDASPAPRLPERTLILRDQLVTEGTAKRHAADVLLPTWDVSLNFVPVLYPASKPAQLSVPAAQRELWRVLNASADLILDVEYVRSGRAQDVALQGLDGVPLRAPEHATHVLLPPGARAEFVVTTPAAGEPASLRTRAVDTGPDGEVEPARTIAIIHAAAATRAGKDSAQESAVDRELRAPENAPAAPFAGLDAHAAVYQRRLYFSEHTDHPGDKEARTTFFLTIDGRTPRPYIMGQPADIRVHRGAVEEWTIENRAHELHVFHIHQVHFNVVAINGAATGDEALRDTIAVPYWSGSGPYPSVRVRLDFHDRNIVGSFVYHCHILGHEDAGMMGGIDVLPEGLATTISLRRDAPGTLLAIVSTTTDGLAPTGTVQFQQDGHVLAEVPLVNGRATLAGVATNASLAALYAGDAFFQGSIATVATAVFSPTPSPQPASH